MARRQDCGDGARAREHVFLLPGNQAAPGGSRAARSARSSRPRASGRKGPARSPEPQPARGPDPIVSRNTRPLMVTVQPARFPPAPPGAPRRPRPASPRPSPPPPAAPFAFSADPGRRGARAGLWAATRVHVAAPRRRRREGGREEAKLGGGAPLGRWLRVGAPPGWEARIPEACRGPALGQTLDGGRLGPGRREMQVGRQGPALTIRHPRACRGWGCGSVATG